MRASMLLQESDHGIANVILYPVTNTAIWLPMTGLARSLWRGMDGRLDRLAIGLSALCLVHCLATTVLLAVLASAGGALGAPIVHEIGLVLATLFGVVAFARGILRHGRTLPVIVGGIGLVTMASALAMPHGGMETLCTVLGVAMLALGHRLNHRLRA